MYLDRKNAGRKLAKKLRSFSDENAVVLAIPRGVLPLGQLWQKS